MMMRIMKLHFVREARLNLALDESLSKRSIKFRAARRVAGVRSLI